MSFLSPGFTIHRSLNLVLGDLGAAGCPAGPVWTNRSAGPGANSSRNIVTGSSSAIAFGGPANSGSIGRVDTTTFTAAIFPTVVTGLGSIDFSCACYMPGIGAGLGRYVLFTGLRVANAAYVTSDDEGLTWTVRALPAAIAAGVATFANGIAIVLEGDSVSSSVGYTSPDGINWTLIAMDRASKWVGLAFNPNANTWLAVSATLDKFTSKSIDNGTTWTATTGHVFTPDGIGRMTFATTTLGGAPQDTFMLGSGSSGQSNSRFTTDNGTTWNDTTASTGVGSQMGTPIFAQGEFMVAMRSTQFVYVGPRGLGFIAATAASQNRLSNNVGGLTQLGFLGAGKYFYVSDLGGAGSGAC